MQVPLHTWGIGGQARLNFDVTPAPPFDATNEVLQDRRKARKEKAKENEWIKVPWRNPELQIFDLAAIINVPEVKKTLPCPKQSG